MFAVFLIAAGLIAHTHSAAIPESEVVPVETVVSLLKFDYHSSFKI